MQALWWDWRCRETMNAAKRCQNCYSRTSETGGDYEKVKPKSKEYRAAEQVVKRNMKRAALKEKAKRKRMSGLDKYIIFSFAVLLLYTSAQTFVTLKTGVESNTLTTCFFSVFGGEVLLCALIKRLKLKNETKKNESEEKGL